MNEISATHPIVVRSDTLASLKAAKKSPRESNDDVIRRLLKMAKP